MSDERQRPWVAPRSGGYSARRTGEPKPPPPTGPGAASRSHHIQCRDDCNGADAAPAPGQVTPADAPTPDPVRCEDCHGNGEVLYGSAISRCDACGGTGYEPPAPAAVAAPEDREGAS